MNKEFEAHMVIRSTEKSERDNFYLLQIDNNSYTERYKIIDSLNFAYLHSYNHPAQMHWKFMRFVGLFVISYHYIFPSSKSDYENFISNNPKVKATPCYFVEINNREVTITYSYGNLIKYNLKKWCDIGMIIKILDSIVKYDFVLTNNTCPCTKCIVRTMCLEMRDDLNVIDTIFVEDQIPIKEPFVISHSLEARNPCPEFNDWKKNRFEQLWNTLPDDIKELESKNYKEMLLKNSDKN